MIQYTNIKKRYIELKKLYGGSSYSYMMDPRGINYYITININSGKNKGVWKLIIGNPSIFKSSCDDINIETKDCKILQNFINSIDISIYKGKKEYETGLLYDAYNGKINSPQKYNFTLNKEIKALEWNNSYDTKEYTPNSWVYINYYLIQNYITNSETLTPRIIYDSDEVKNNNLYGDENKKWALLPYQTSLINNDVLCDDHKYNFKYFIPIFDDNIKTIFHFTKEHMILLTDIKEKVIDFIITNKWSKCKYNVEEMKTKIIIYTLFPNQKYLYPFFLVDYHDDLGINYTRIVDKTRMITIEYIIEHLKNYNDMQKYYCKYYISHSNNLFILAQQKVKQSLRIFFKIFTDILYPKKINNNNKYVGLESEEDKKEDEKEDDEKEDEKEDDEKEETIINNIIIQNIVKLDLNNISLRVEIFNNGNLTDDAKIILKNTVNYKYLHYFQKYLLNNDSIYSFITQWEVLLIEKKPIQHKKTQHKQLQKPEEKHELPILSEYKVLMSYFDGTRGTSPFRTYIGVYCKKDNDFFQINIISDRLFKDNKIATGDEFPLIDHIKNKLDGKNIKNVFLQQGIDGYYYGNGTNRNKIPCFVEIHKLPGELENILNKNILVKVDNKIKYDDYSDYLYSYNLIKGNENITLKKETLQRINSDLKIMTYIKLDDKLPLLFAIILYRYTNNQILKDIIRKKLFDDIPEKYIFFNVNSPFIIFPDKSLQKSYNEHKNKKNFNIQSDNYNMIVWHADKYIYDNALKVIYDNGDSVENIIKNLSSKSDYPFTKGLIDKFLVKIDESQIRDPCKYPHTFRYTSINLLDKLYIFLNDFETNTNNIFNINIIDTVIERYFHNPLLVNSILHLHLRAKHKKHKLRHIYGGLYNDYEYLRVYDLDDVYRNLLYDAHYYRHKLLYASL